jgi:hypothetical protein
MQFHRVALVDGPAKLDGGHYYLEDDDEKSYLRQLSIQGIGIK